MSRNRHHEQFSPSQALDEGLVAEPRSRALNAVTLENFLRYLEGEARSLGLATASSLIGAAALAVMDGEIDRSRSTAH